MDPISVHTLRAVVDAVAGARFYGLYEGRFYFRGVALTVPDSRSLICLGSALAVAGGSELAEHRPHLDDMGRDLLVAWPDWMFRDLETLDEED